MTRQIIAVAVVASGFILAGCSGPAEPVPASTAVSAPAPTTTAPVPACAGPFSLGQPVTAELAKLTCVDPNGVPNAQHTVTCKDGRTMVFDSDLKVYGFPGGKLAAMDTAADSAYARDYAKCQTG